MIKEIQIFFNAMMFLTRLPCSKWTDFSEENLNKSSKYFSLIGIIVGALGALVYYLFSLVLPHSVAILLSIIATILITGAFHEDGFADVCDSFGGGFDKEHILKIMKDSRLGTYGTLGLVLILTLKYLLLLEIDPNLIIMTIIAGHSISRFSAVSVLYTHDYMRDTDKSSKTKPIAKKLTSSGMIVSAFFGILPLFFLGKYVFLLIIPVFITRELAIKYFTARIGGYTGDCLGAIQQLCEVTFYLFMLLELWKYI